MDLKYIFPLEEFKMSPGLNVEDLTEMKFYLLTVTGQWDHSGTAWDPRDGIFKCGGSHLPPSVR